MGITIDKVIGKYIELRDELKVIGERHAAELKPVQEQMDKLESWLLASLIQSGVDSFKTSVGTAYKSVTMSTKMDDREAFLAVATEHPYLTDIRVSKSGVQEYMENNGGAVPAGVKIDNHTKVNIRRA
jgi:hypothetical protein